MSEKLFHDEHLTRNCSNCGILHNRSHNYCNICHAAYMRDWRYCNFNYQSKEARLKSNVRRLANHALESGKIKQLSCRIEGCQVKPEMHHHDYSKPLDVEFLCPPHHQKKEREIREQENQSNEKRSA